MGTALPPNEPGSPCLNCFGTGLPFGDVVTPKFLSLKLTNLTPGPFFDSTHSQLLATPHLLEQTASPCSWLIDDGVFGWQIIFGATTASVLVQQLSPIVDAFRSFNQPTCMLEYEDDGVFPLQRFALDGVINIEWSTKGL